MVYPFGLILLLVICTSNVNGDRGCRAKHGVCQGDTEHCAGTYETGLCSVLTHDKCCVPTDREHIGWCSNFGGECISADSTCDGTLSTSNDGGCKKTEHCCITYVGGKDDTVNGATNECLEDKPLLKSMAAYSLSVKPTKECRTTIPGSEYAGKLNTASGTPCLPWSSGAARGMQNYDESNFPEGSEAAASNFCRNPTNYKKGPWCITKAKPGYKSCKVDMCKTGKECIDTVLGSDYSGKQDNAGGTPCLPWASGIARDWQNYDATNFPEGSEAGASNFCRNPTNYVDGPWCLTTAAPGWKRCHIPYCPSLRKRRSIDKRVVIHGDFNNTDIKIMLYNPAGKVEELIPHEPSQLFDSSAKETILIIHGFQGNIDGGEMWEKELKDELRKLDESKNVILVDWRKHADMDVSGLFYFGPMGNTHTVATKVARVLSQLINCKYHLDPKKVTCMGHSLGAHTCGHIGMQLATMNMKIARIIGMDPAGPGYQTDKFPNVDALIDYDVEKRLDPSDADQVIAIHTDTDKWGYKPRIGTVDFYVNAGEDQPGCNNYTFACDHGRSHEYVTEGISNAGKFMATKCENFNPPTDDTYDIKKCEGGTDQIPMGYHTPATASGQYYLETNYVPICTEKDDRVADPGPYTLTDKCRGPHSKSTI